jgi:hypothetical protein
MPDRPETQKFSGRKKNPDFVFRTGKKAMF